MGIVSYLLGLGCAVAVVAVSIGCKERREPAEEKPPAEPAVETPPADLVLFGGKVVTVDEARPVAQAIAITGDTITAVGTDAEIRARIGAATEVIDLDGRLAIPGFVDAHAHFLSIGAAALELDLTAARTWDEIVALVSRAARDAAPGEWIVGRGWHQEKWDRAPDPAVEGLPTHAALSHASPRNPVVLFHASGGHGAIANAQAMELAGIDRQTPDPPGGQIVRDRRGEPIGVFREAAVELVSRHVDRRRAGMERLALAAAEECVSKGVTTLHDAGTTLAEVALLKRLADQGRLLLRLYAMLNEDDEQLAAVLPQGKLVGYGGGRVTVRAIKRIVDGALGSHGAWLLEPYADLPGSTGLNTLPPESLERTARLAAEHGFQLGVHAIGDRGNRETLDVFERVMREHPSVRDLRWRVEHAQHLHPDDLPRFAALGVIASMQPIHCTSDGPWVPTRLGRERAGRGSYAWKSLLESGALVAAGTDAPVEDVDPIANFHAAVTRQMGNGQRFHPEERMTRQQALEAYTIRAAWAGFEEGVKGSLAPGKLADVVVLSRDITAVPEDEIRRAEVVYTIVGGRIVYHRK